MARGKHYPIPVNRLVLTNEINQGGWIVKGGFVVRKNEFVVQSMASVKGVLRVYLENGQTLDIPDPDEVFRETRYRFRVNGDYVKPTEGGGLKNFSAVAFYFENKKLKEQADLNRQAEEARQAEASRVVHEKYLSELQKREEMRLEQKRQEEERKKFQEKVFSDKISDLFGGLIEAGISSVSSRGSLEKFGGKVSCSGGSKDTTTHKLPVLVFTDKNGVQTKVKFEVHVEEPVSWDDYPVTTAKILINDEEVLSETL